MSCWKETAMAIWTGWHGSCGWNGEVMLWRSDYTLKFPDSLGGLTRLSNRMYSQLRFILAKGVIAAEKMLALEGVPRSQPQASKSSPFINHIRCTFLSTGKCRDGMQSVSAQGSLLKCQDPKVFYGGLIM